MDERNAMKRIILLFIIASSANIAASGYVRNAAESNLKYSSSLKSKEQSVKAEYFLLRSSYSGYLPSLSYKLEHGHETNKKFNSTSNDPKTRLTRSFHSMTLSQHLFNGGKTQATVQKNKQNYLQKLTEYKIQESSEIDSFLTQYIKAYYAYKYNAIAKKTHAFSQELHTYESKNSKSGLSSKDKLASAYKAVQTNWFNVLATENDLKYLQYDLSRKTNIKDLKLYKPSLALPSPLLSKLKREVKTNNLNIKLAQIKAAIKKTAIIETSAELYFPKVNLLGKVIYDRNASGTAGYSRTKFIGVSFEYSPLVGGRDLNTLKSSKHSYNESIHAVQAVIDDKTSRLVKSLNDYIRARREFTINMSLEKRLYNLAQSISKSSKQGHHSVIELYKSRQSYLTVQKNKLKSEEKSLLATVKLLSLMGRLNLNSIK